MSEIEVKKFEEAREKAESEYKGFDLVYCPYLQCDVIFNAKGWGHLRFKAERQARSHQDQYIRFRLISLAPKILKASHTLQGITKRKQFEHEKTQGRWQYVAREVTFYEFVAVIHEVRVRVIVKQIEDGPKYFWSIIPFWKSDKSNNKRTIHSGRPETD